MRQELILLFDRTGMCRLRSSVERRWSSDHKNHRRTTSQTAVLGRRITASSFTFWVMETFTKIYVINLIHVFIVFFSTLSVSVSAFRLPFLQRVNVACYEERCLAMIDSACLSVRPSVRPSVCNTLVSCQMTLATIMLFSLADSPMTPAKYTWVDYVSKYAPIDAVGFSIWVTLSRWLPWRHLTQCCHLVSAHEASAARLCSSLHQFLISSLFNQRQF